MTITYTKSGAEPSIPMDLVCGLPNMGFDFKLKDIKAIAPEIVFEEEIGDDVKVTINTDALIKAAKKFMKTNL